MAKRNGVIGKVNLEGWDLRADASMNKALGSFASEVVQSVLEDEKLRQVYFANRYKARSGDALEMRLTFDIGGKNSLGEVSIPFSLGDVIDDWVEEYREDRHRRIYERPTELRKVSDALKKLAAKIDKICQTELSKAETE